MLRDEVLEDSEVVFLLLREVVVVVDSCAICLTSVAFLTLRVVPLPLLILAVREVKPNCGFEV